MVLHVHVEERQRLMFYDQNDKNSCGDIIKYFFCLPELTHQPILRKFIHLHMVISAQETVSNLSKYFS